MATSFLCKIFNFFLGVITMVVDTVAGVIKVVGAAVIDVLESALDAVGGALGSLFGSGGLMMPLLIGGAAWFLFLRKKDDKQPLVIPVPRAPLGESS